MCRENSGWGAPRIHGELLKLGIDIGETSVSKYMVRFLQPPSQTWRTFLKNHVAQLVSVDFFTVPTICFQVLYVFLVLAHDRRRALGSVLGVEAGRCHSHRLLLDRDQPTILAPNSAAVAAIHSSHIE